MWFVGMAGSVRGLLLPHFASDRPWPSVWKRWQDQKWRSGLMEAGLCAQHGIRRSLKVAPGISPQPSQCGGERWPWPVGGLQWGMQK